MIIFIMALFPNLEDVHGEMITDQLGRQMDVPENPQRVISLAPSITEIVFDLQQEKRLVGVTQFSTYPDAAKNIPRVGSYVRLDLEKIIALKPDLCLSIKDGNPLHIINRIEEMGIPVYAIDPRNLNQTMETIVLLGEILQAQQIAESLVDDMRKRIAKVQSRLTGTLERPQVFFQIDANPIVSAGNNTFINELIELAGGINTAAGKDPYPRFNWEDILHLQPEIVVISAMAGGLDDQQLKKTWQHWEKLSAVRNKQVFVVDAGMFDRATPRLIAGLETLAKIIHPDLFYTGVKN
ncbi:MAG: cobalamin-binding protein [Proteobacteria bacterium]|nr:cobalamin-binding protein [Pseudomonadota bacterium]